MRRYAVVGVIVVIAACFCLSATSSARALASTSVKSTAGASPRWWVPPLGNQPWQWELSTPLNLKNARSMGTNAKLPNGSPAPVPTIYDIDGIINPASTISALHVQGRHAVCYIEVGAAGDYYTAADEGIPTTYYTQLKAAGLFGVKVSGWPEYNFDIRSPVTVSIIESMIAQQCAGKGFDAVETDIDTEYASNSGFPLSKAIEEQYLTTLVSYMHGLGLGWWIKNPDDTGDSFATDMYPLADAVLSEQCNQYASCGQLSAYLGHKAVFNAEYKLNTRSFCAADDALGFNGTRFKLNLAGTRMPCR